MYFSEPEPQIMDFLTQQHKLFPNIAGCFAFQYAANWLWETYNNVTGELESGQLENLPEVSASRRECINTLLKIFSNNF